MIANYGLREGSKGEREKSVRALRWDLEARAVSYRKVAQAPGAV